MEVTEANDITPGAIETVPSPIQGTHGEITTGMDPNLYNAAFEGNVDAFQQIQDIELQLTPNMNTVLHVHFTAETESVSKEFVEFIISSCPLLILQANSKGETPLHIAARYGHLVAVQVLIEVAKSYPEDVESGIGAQKRVIRATNEAGDSALHEAVRYNHIQVVRLLTKEDPDHPYSGNKDGETPLYIAVERSHKKILYEILKNCKSPAYGGPNGRTALHSAVLHRDEETVKGLLEKEHLRSSIREADEQGCLPLHLAVQHCERKMTKLLLDQDRKTTYMRDKEGRTALHLAVREYKSATAEMILSYCPDCAEIADNNGQNALHYALSNYYYSESTTNIIIKKTSLSNLYNEKDADGNTPLHLFFSSVDHRPSGYDEVAKFIEHQRVDKLAFNKQNRTALDILRHLVANRESQAGRSYKIIDRLNRYGGWKVKGQRIQTPARKDNKNDDEEERIKSAKDSHLIAATVIATVTFAAGFSLPGGTFQDGENPGTPILKQKAAFKAFVVTNTIAMILSATAVLIHMFLALVQKVISRARLLIVAFFMTMIAMASMMIAFVTGTYAMMGVSSGLGILVIVMGTSPGVCIVILIFLTVGLPLLVLAIWEICSPI